MGGGIDRTTLGRNGLVAVVRAIRNQAQELERLTSGILELMDIVRFHEHDVSGANRVGGVVLVDLAFTFNHIDLMFIRVMVSGRMPTGFYLELPHGKAWGTIIAAQ